jgi:23S rRNA pseudouridine2605 synthase
LDLESEGLLLFTNDGELANRLMHPKYHKSKIYHVKIRGEVDAEKIEALGKPMMIDGYRTKPAGISVITRKQDYTVLAMELFEGRNRQIRKMCEQAGLTVKRLSRVSIGNLKLDGLPVGKWRYLDEREVEYLYKATKERKNV